MSNDCSDLKELSERHTEMLKADLPVAFYSVQQSVSGAAVTAEAQKEEPCTLDLLGFLALFQSRRQ